MVLFLRHGRKKYSDGSGPKGSYQYDPSLNLDDNEIKRISKHVEKLVDKYKAPTEIICSPYLRCRQTAYEIQKVLKLLGIEVNVNIDPRLGEYFRGQYIIDLKNQVNKETSEHHLYNNESPLQIRKRLSEILDNPDQKEIWYITHGVVIQILHEIKTGKVISHPSTLSGIVSTENSFEEVKVE